MVLIDWEDIYQIKYSPIAQSVERVTVNHDVVGSSPTWGAKKKSRSNDLLFFVSKLSSQSITCVSMTMELVKEAPAVVPTERPLRKQSGGLFLGRGGEAVGLDRGTRCEAMCAVCCGESTTLAGQARVFACGKTIPAATLPPWGATYN